MDIKMLQKKKKSRELSSMLWKGSSNVGKSGPTETLKSARKIKGDFKAETDPSPSKRVGFNVKK